MARRKGMGKGKGMGYKNMIPKDPKVHSQSAKGMKQPQRIINLMRVPYGSPKTLIESREYQIGFGQPVGTIKEFENVFGNENVKLSVPMTLKEKMEVTKKSNLKDSDKDGVADILDCDPNDPTKQGSFSAEIVLQQLGGQRFIAMTGANSFVKNDKLRQIWFKIPRTNGINAITISLNSKDLYDIEFGYGQLGKNPKYTVRKEVKDVYFDQLQEIFTRETGLYTHL